VLTSFGVGINEYMEKSAASVKIDQQPGWFLFWGCGVCGGFFFGFWWLVCVGWVFWRFFFLCGFGFLADISIFSKTERFDEGSVRGSLVGGFLYMVYCTLTSEKLLRFITATFGLW